MFPGRGEGEYRGDQDDARFDAVAAGLDGDGKAVFQAAQDDAFGMHLGIEQGDQPGAGLCQQPGERKHEGLPYRFEDIQSEQDPLDKHEKQEESEHGEQALS